MNRRSLICLALFSALLTACASAPEPLEVSEAEELDATVVAVDTDARTLALRGPEGNVVELNVDPEVRNLSQVEVGDILRVSYYTGLLISIAEPGTGGTGMAVAAGRTAEGARPGAMLGATISATVEILSVANGGTAVSFRDPEGHVESIDVPDEEGRAFARKLRQGDLVDVQYTEAVAVAVQPADSDG